MMECWKTGKIETADPECWNNGAMELGQRKKGYAAKTFSR
jgi:hypothetical protein